MGDERRWAARYQFLEQLWRGRDRILCDRDLEGALHAGVEGPLADLLEDLLPADGGDARAWVALHNERRAASFARARSGTVFASVEDGPEFAADEDWQLALINLGDQGVSEAMEPFLEVLGERAEDDARRSVVLCLDVGEDEDASYERLADLVADFFGDGRIYGLARTQVAAIFDFGTVLESDEQPEPPPPEFDNSLGSEAPNFELFVAVVGAELPSEGTLYVELPSSEELAQLGSEATRTELEELAALRAQVGELQRRADGEAIERQDLLEQLEASEQQVAKLEEALELDGERQQRVEAAARLDQLLASEQALRWELDRARGELESLRSRPVHELEAEVASLRAQLERSEAALEHELDHSERVESELSEQQAQEVLVVEDDDAPTASQMRAWLAVRGRLEQLLRKLERGSQVSALELYRELDRLRRLL